MEETLQEILSVLQEINSKLDDIKGSGLYNSISDIHEKLDSIQGELPYSIQDIHYKID